MQRQGFGIRLGAAIIDGVIILVGMVLLSLVFGFGAFTAASRGGGAAAGVSIVAVLLMALWPLAYSSTEIFMAASPGKKLLGLTIANQDGSPAAPPVLATRWAV
ncbi:MAG: RDD family protein, partial [Tepidisphaeraceae bacterium]